MAEQLIPADEIREVVRERYAAAAMDPDPRDACGCDCGPSSTPLGCGNPTAVADLLRERWSSTSAPAAGLTSCCPLSGSGSAARRTAST